MQFKARPEIEAPVRGGYAFREAGSLVFGSAGTMLEEEGLLAKRLLAVVAMLVFGAGAVLRLLRPDSHALAVAAVGDCYIAVDAGNAWHSVRQCQRLALALHVEQVSIVEAQRRGEGVRWQQPCRVCGGLLRANPGFLAKRDEYELLRRLTNRNPGVGGASPR